MFLLCQYLSCQRIFNIYFKSFFIAIQRDFVRCRYNIILVQLRISNSSERNQIRYIFCYISDAHPIWECISRYFWAFLCWISDIYHPCSFYTLRQTGTLHGQLFACACRPLTNHRAPWMLSTFGAALRLVNGQQAQAKSCP